MNPDLKLALVDLERAAQRLAAALEAEPARPDATNGTAEPDRLVGVAEAAARLQVKPAWLYAHRAKLPFTRRLPGSRLLRFSARGIDDYLTRKKP